MIFVNKHPNRLRADFVAPNLLSALEKKRLGACDKWISRRINGLTVDEDEQLMHDSRGNDGWDTNQPL